MNTQRQQLIIAARSQDTPFWNRIADDLEAPSRRQREVNLSSIDRHSVEGDVVVVPGKVLGDGRISHKVTIAAFAFSGSARTKLKEAKCEVLTLPELLKKHPKGKGRILG